MKVSLKYNSGFRWHHRDGIYVKGYLFDVRHQLWSEEQLLDYFTYVVDYDSFYARICNANGMFSVIINKGKLRLIAVDLTRNFPLFYHFSNHDLHISDNSHFLADTFGEGINHLSEAEYLATGFTCGNKTLFTNVCQVQPGEVVSFSDNTPYRTFYFSYVTEFLSENNYSSLKSQLNGIIEHIFERLLVSAQNRQIIVPLSSGYDSRLIVTALKKLGVNNVICITYGKKNHSELDVSKRVAEILGYEWVFIEHNQETIDDYIKTEEFLSYFPYSSNGNSFCYMFEYFAVKYLKNIYKIAESSVFIAGHSGDFLGGSQITKFRIEKEYQCKALVDKIYNLKYNYIKPDKVNKMLFRKSIMDYCNPFFDKQGSQYSYSFIEEWDYREKLSKTNANSSNVFSYFGFQYRLPYWDKEIVHFFRQVPYQYKLNKKLYDEVLEENYFKPGKVYFKNQLKKSQFKYFFQLLKSRIKPFMPAFIKRRLNLKVDWADYHLITAPMAEQMRKAGISFRIYDVPFNSVIMQWYLAKIRNKI